MYHDIYDAVIELGSVDAVRDMFVGFQPHLYAKRTAS
jgi:hypothetical protein